ncbi:MAG: alpha/beta hydrolase [Actinomycetota bacterium]
MRKAFALLVVLVLLAVGAGAAVAGGNVSGEISEEIITFESDGGVVVGTMVMPGEVRGKVPAVLLLHGFTGTRDELPIFEPDWTFEETMYSRTARVFAENGIATLRIDFRGSGDSTDGFTFAETTFTTQVADALAAVDFLDDQGRIGRIGVLGLSQGGLVGAVTAEAHKRVESLVLWSPVTNPVDTYKLILGEQNVLDGLNQATTHIVLPWTAIDLNQPFFIDLYHVDPIVAISDYDDPTQVIVGSGDTLVTPQPMFGEVYMTHHEGVEELVVVDGDHIFDALAGNGAPALDEAIGESLDWFQNTLGGRR